MGGVLVFFFFLRVVEICTRYSILIYQIGTETILKSCVLRYIINTIKLRKCGLPKREALDCSMIWRRGNHYERKIGDGGRKEGGAGGCLRWPSAGTTIKCLCRHGGRTLSLNCRNIIINIIITEPV